MHSCWLSTTEKQPFHGAQRNHHNPFRRFNKLFDATSSSVIQLYITLLNLIQSQGNIMQTKSTHIASLIAGATFAAASFAAHATEPSPFAVKQLDQGYQVAQASAAEGKAKDGKCGEGKCGANKSKAHAEKKADGKCGGDKKMDGKCGGDKKMDGKCGAEKDKK
jgi:uncharacterized low-complexity protein